MGSVLERIDDDLREWIAKQRLFFVGTAPTEDGHVNVSPKGAMECFQVLGDHEVAYVDMFGSGAETIAHLKQNGRIVLMFCAFEGPPLIIRLHGRGTVVQQADPGFAGLLARFDLPEKMTVAVRSVIRVEVTRIADSCGFVVPQLTYEKDREQLWKYAEGRIRKHGPDFVRDYCDVNNATSIDGLPGLDPLGSQPVEERRATHSHEGRRL